MTHPDQEHRPPAWRIHLAAYERAWQRYHANPSAAQFALLRTGEELLTRDLRLPGRFGLGMCVMTPGARDAMTEAGHSPLEFLLRHKHGDWGDLDEEDTRANEEALHHGTRLLSVYRTRRDATLWVITEWDRSATTLQLPEEY